jgi:hypothetical protein
MREKQATLERRKQEREQASKKRGSFKFFSRSSKSFEEDAKKELEARVKAKKIDIKALEETRREKSKHSPEKQQKDFRHVLRPVNHPKAKKTPENKSPSKSRNEADIGHSTRQQPRVEGKIRSRNIQPSEATELTGSWDYIPSEPSSTVDLLANPQEDGGSVQVRNKSALKNAVEQYAQQRDHPSSDQPNGQQEPLFTEHSERHRRQENQGRSMLSSEQEGSPFSAVNEGHSRQQRQGQPFKAHGSREYSRQQVQPPQNHSVEQESPPSQEQGARAVHHRDDSDDLATSSPIFDLSSTFRITTEGPPQEWNGGRQNWNMPNQDVDYETQF